MLFRHILVTCVVVLSSTFLTAQSNLIVEDLLIDGDTVYLKHHPIIVGSFSSSVPEGQYSVNEFQGYVVLKDSSLRTLKCAYRIFPKELFESYALRDTLIIQPENASNFKPILAASRNNDDDIFGAGLNKTGSISRGVSFGNNQNLSVNSNLNLQMSGKIAPEIEILASVTDDNIPIQPQGNTQQLQDFDQVFIKVFNDNNWELIAGDFWLKSPAGYFMKYNKRAQGGTFQSTFKLNELEKSPKLNVQMSGAISKGKFGRNVVQGIEGNQGPYRLVGSNNEPFIVVLSGTERVFIDGKLLERGQQNDYIIDYNTAELTFTPKQLITKDRRITVEFQYSDQNYARSLFQAHVGYESKKFRSWINAYSEQDAKNQPLNINLNDEQKLILALSGDQLNQALASSIDTASYSDNRILYYLIDTNVTSGLYQNVLLHTSNNDTNLYKATFSDVGLNNGNYVIDQISALGRIYKWVEPVGGIPQGQYEPVVLLSAPNKQQMVSSGFDYQINKLTGFGLEGAFSNQDLNTFSDIDQGDNQGFALKPFINLGKQLDSSQSLSLKLNGEFLSENYTSIERFRSVEFTRNWNTRNLNLSGAQYMGTANVNYKKSNQINLDYLVDTYINGSDYVGVKHNLNSSYNQKHFRAGIIGSYLTTSGLLNSTFLRHKANFEKDLGPVIIRFNDEHELNSLREDTLASYQFYDWQVSVLNDADKKNRFKVFYRQRLDRKPDSSGTLLNAALANQFGAEAKFRLKKGQTINFNLSYRDLTISDTTLINQASESTLLGRVEHKGRLFKGILSTSTYYEVGSGLELRKEFQYVEVQAGQGNFTWIDYDNDGIKDLNEFEIAAFQDQANYIRIFTPTNEYVKIFTNQFSQSIFLKPELLWRKEKGLKGVLAKFSNQLIFRADRKTNSVEANELYNPFVTAIDDEQLISVSSTFRNTVFFNRTHQTFGLDYSYLSNDSKVLLTSGFDSRFQKSHEIRTRWNITRKLTIQAQGDVGSKGNIADYTSGRDYEINSHTEQVTFSYQPSTKFRVSVNGLFSQKVNDPAYGNEEAQIIDNGLELRYNQSSKGSLNVKFNVIQNKYTGNENTTLSYEMLDALKVGTNYTWSLLYQRSIGKNLQLNLNYNGRNTPGNITIHTGGVQIRALF